MLGNLKLRNYYYLVSENVNYLIFYLFTFGEVCEVFIPSLIMFGCFYLENNCNTKYIYFLFSLITRCRK